MLAAEYDKWYQTPRGHWIGETESGLLRRMLEPRSGESLLDVGCGTGYFTRQFARADKLAITWLDPNRDWLAFAERHAVGTESDVLISTLLKRPLNTLTKFTETARSRVLLP